MHPAPSIIVFSTLSGLGYGLAAMLGLGLLDPAAMATKLAHLAAFGLIVAGLLSSTLHLGNPQRAWRAFSQWRSSWLSREGVMAVASFLPLGLSALLCWWRSDFSPVLGLAGALMAAGTVYCTSMIYASLKSIDAWHSWLTPACYLLFAAAGGLLLGSVFALAGGAGGNVAPVAAIIVTIAAWATKLAWWRRVDGLAPISTPETATGLGSIGKVRLFERPHINDNYLTREMGYRVARKHAAKLRGVALVLGGAMPVTLLALALTFGVSSGAFACGLAALATISHLAGVLVERWLFFAQARHATMNYYGG